VVYLLLISLNVALLANILMAKETAATVRVTLFRVPGGVAGVVEREGQNRADLVITGLSSRRYSLTDRIILPQLTRMGTKSLDNIFILSADFDAVRDVFSLADSLNARRILFDRSLERSFFDVRELLTGNGKSYRLKALFPVEKPEIPERPSYRLTTRGLNLTACGKGIVFCDRISPALLNASSTSEELHLVLGSPWQADRADLWRVLGCGFEGIICSEIAHTGSGSDRPGEDFHPSSLSEVLYDLNLDGPITLNL
jgi:hypothetical protein